MNNVAALALLMPMDIQAAYRAKRSPALTLMPLSFASILGGMVTLICPREPFGELAHASRWMENRSNPFPSVRDYIERQIAFDADETGRIIAMASLEPIPRNGRRIANAMR